MTRSKPANDGEGEGGEGTMTEKLKPCPWCGKQPLLDSFGIEAEPEFCVMCTARRCPVNPCATHASPTAEAAIAVWNKRTAPGGKAKP